MGPRPQTLGVLSKVLPLETGWGELSLLSPALPYPEAEGLWTVPG